MAQTGEAFENAGAYSLAWLPSPSPGHFAATPAAKDFLEWLKGLRTYQNSAGGFLATVESTTLAAESITLGYLRSHGCRDLLIYCEAMSCNHSKQAHGDYKIR
jgi:hypothetical protein